MVKIDAGFVRYNANTGNKYVGDCVVRSLSIAFGIDYNAVRSELNRIKRELNQGGFNYSPVFNRFLKDRGVQFTPYTTNDGPITEEEFSNLHPSGTYLLLTGKESNAARGVSTHMVCIMNGDIYDSWDSSEYCVVQWCKVLGGTTSVNMNLDYHEILPELKDYLTAYVDKLSTRFTEYDSKLELVDHQNTGHVDRMTYDGLYVVVKLGETPYYSRWMGHQTFGKQLVVKLNPAKSLEENLKLLKSKLKQRIYDFAYDIRKDLSDAARADSVFKSEEFNPNYRGDLRKLMQLPSWSYPYVTYFSDEGSSYYGYKYEVQMDAMEDDPRGSFDSEVVFKEDTLRELKQAMEEYRKHFRRFGYDY